MNILRRITLVLIISFPAVSLSHQEYETYYMESYRHSIFKIQQLGDVEIEILTSRTGAAETFRMKVKGEWIDLPSFIKETEGIIIKSMTLRGNNPNERIELTFAHVNFAEGQAVSTYKTSIAYEDGRFSEYSTTEMNGTGEALESYKKIIEPDGR
ncbi:MAG: hypothetical protein AAGH40_13295 [Verrucomicrobiota bacterium]